MSEYITKARIYLAVAELLVWSLVYGAYSACAWVWKAVAL